VLRNFSFGRIKRYVLPALLLVALVWASFVYTGEHLTELQNERQRQIFEPAVNNQIYTYFANHGGPGDVLSPYPVGWLPGLQGYWVNDKLLDYEEYQRILENKPEIEYLLIYDRADPAIWAEVNANIETGDYVKLFREGEFTFVDLEP